MMLKLILILFKHMIAKLSFKRKKIVDGWCKSKTEYIKHLNPWYHIPFPPQNIIMCFCWRQIYPFDNKCVELCFSGGANVIWRWYSQDIKKNNKILIKLILILFKILYQYSTWLNCQHILHLWRLRFGSRKDLNVTKPWA